MVKTVKSEVKRAGTFLVALAVVMLLASVSSAADFKTGVTAYLNEEYERAMLEWAECAKDGDARAMAYIGYIYFAGLGFPQDDAKAFEWFERAAEKGDPDAIASLARMYAHGWGVEKDMEEAFALMERVKEKDNFAAQMVASEFYENGFGTEVDLEKALEHAERLPMSELGLSMASTRDRRIQEIEKKIEETRASPSL